ncbi:MAG: OmpA family protein [Chitinophagales bacterium]|nr:OmpA family protein [Chitinophagales bacterium]MDW8427074.1 OmpA family protein [Chitinophagales bacterium]
MFPNRPFVVALALSTFAVSLPTNTYGQQYFTARTAGKSVLREWQRANDLIARKQYAEAANQLQVLMQKEPRFIDAPLLLGELLLLAEHYQQSAQALERVVALDSRYAPKAWLFLAQSYWQMDSLAQCITACDSFLQMSNTSAERRQAMERLRRNALFAQEARRHPVPFSPKPLPSTINSDLPEYLPCLTGDEQTIVFTRRLGQGLAAQEDFYFSRRMDGRWQPAAPISSLNSVRNEGAQTLTADGNAMYFVMCDKPGGWGSCDIYYAERAGQRWSEPVNLGPPVCTAAWETQPSVAADGRTLYFVSTRPGGKGGSDIWISVRNESGQWSEPVNAGDSINTIYDEKSPYIHPDGVTLYFASNGHPGMGGDDIFVARRRPDGSWSRPSNLGYPINTKDDENSLFVALSGQTAYFASDRFSGSNDFDLYAFELYTQARPSPVAYITGTVTDAVTEQPLAAELQLFDVRTGTLVAASKSDVSDGRYLIALRPGTDYALHAIARGYLFFSKHFSLSQWATIRPDTLPVQLKALAIGQSMPLYNIFFDHDSYALKPESEVELQRLVVFLRQNPTVRIRIDGHTDDVGSHEHNQRLSENRARAVLEYLAANGIEPTRLSYKGFGETQPVATNLTDEGRARNRRTEITIIAK